MHSSIKRAAFAVGIAATVIALGAATASATGTWTIKAGTTTTGSTTYTGTATGTASAPAIMLKDLTSGTTLTCQSGGAAGPLTLGTNHTGTPITTITSTSWGPAGTCKGPFGLVLTPAQVGTWNLNAVSYNATTGVTTGNISNVKANITSTPVGQCAFTVMGSVDVTYNNSTHVLAVAPVTGSGHTLAISAVSGCFGAVNNGDTATFSASYAITTPLGFITLTSP